MECMDGSYGKPICADCGMVNQFEHIAPQRYNRQSHLLLIACYYQPLPSNPYPTPHHPPTRFSRLLLTDYLLIQQPISPNPCLPHLVIYITHHSQLLNSWLVIRMQSSKQPRLLTHHSSNILHLRTVQNNLITAGSDGELRLYVNTANQEYPYLQVDCLKLFECPIVACEVAPDCSIAVAGYSGQIKICRIVKASMIVIEREVMVAELGSPIVSCAWSWEGQLVVSTELGAVFVVEGHLGQLVYQADGQPRKQNLTLVRRGGNGMYLAYRSKVATFEYDLKNHNFITKPVIRTHQPILDFTISNEPIYPTLVVLTQHQLTFYLLHHQQPIKTAAFEVDKGAIGSKLGWGVSCEQLGLYQCVDGIIKTSRFCRSLNGKWRSSDSSKMETGTSGLMSGSGMSSEVSSSEMRDN